MQTPWFNQVSRELSYERFVDLTRQAEAGDRVAAVELEKAVFRQAFGIRPAPAARLSRQDLADIRKAITNPLFSGAVPFDANPNYTPIRSDGQLTQQRMPTDVRNPNGAEPAQAAWVAAGQYQYLRDGVGTADDTDVRGHSDVYAAGARRVEDSGRGDPELGQARNRGQDFTANPVSYDRGPNLGGIPTTKALLTKRAVEKLTKKAIRTRRKLLKRAAV